MSIDHSDYLNSLFRDLSVIALTSRQSLEPAEGAGTPFFPATYPQEQGKDNKKGGRYCISGGAAPGNFCVVDSVQSQANRMESAFLAHPYRALIKQVSITASLANGEEQCLDMLQLGHRAADAGITFSTLAATARSAILAWKKGNAEELAKLSPMSLLCGMWDSRPSGTQLKIPRAFSANVHATNVRELRRNAAFSSSFHKGDLGLVINDADAGSPANPFSKLLVAPVLSGETHGGVVSEGVIRRVTTLNLIALRQNCMAVAADTPVSRYIFALGLVALTLPFDNFLRQGCLLVPSEPMRWEIIHRDGVRQTLSLDHEQALALANVAAAELGIPEEQPLHGRFQQELAMAASQAAGSRRQQRSGSTGTATEEAEE